MPVGVCVGSRNPGPAVITTTIPVHSGLSPQPFASVKASGSPAAIIPRLFTKPMRMSRTSGAMIRATATGDGCATMPSVAAVSQAPAPEESSAFASASETPKRMITCQRPDHPGLRGGDPPARTDHPQEEDHREHGEHLALRRGQRAQRPQLVRYV